MLETDHLLDFFEHNELSIKIKCKYLVFLQYFSSILP